MSESVRSTAGVILVVIPAVIYGGVSLLEFLRRKSTGYVDNPLRQNLYRAGHAHAGVLLVLALVAMLYLDRADLGAGAKSLVRICLVLPPILMPLGFFLSVASPRATKPNALIALVYLGAVVLAVGTVVLGIGLLR
jgi:hypothetical protein